MSPRDPVSMIELTNVSKQYGPKLAVDGVSFSAVPGRVTGFLGPNGAGSPAHCGFS